VTCNHSMLRAPSLLLCVTILGCQPGEGGGSGRGGSPADASSPGGGGSGSGGAPGGGGSGGGGSGGGGPGGAAGSPAPARDGGPIGGTGGTGGRGMDAGGPRDGGAGAGGGGGALDAGGGGRDQAAPPNGDGSVVVIPPGATPPVFDTKILHRIEITVASQHLAALDMKDRDERVPCNIVVDGTSLPNSGVRSKGGNGSWRPLAQKAAFSIKFNQFVMAQKLSGLTKLLLNNAVQDPSLLNEHLVYEIARRAGAAAPLTAHAAVTFNGQPYGFFVVREAINDDFLRRSYGKDNEDGNLYEGGEFVESPNSPELKDEVEEMRTRDDVRAASMAIRMTPDPMWAAVVGTKLDFPSFFTGYAIEGLIDHWDGYFYGPHNYYIYNHPATGRFVFILGGADSIFSRVRALELDPKVLLAKKFLQLPETATALRARMAEIAAALDVPAMHARADEAARVLRSYTGTDARSRSELSAFETNLARKKSAMTAIKNYRPTAP
jgi:spore coat protein H